MLFEVRWSAVNVLCYLLVKWQVKYFAVHIASICVEISQLKVYETVHLIVFVIWLWDMTPCRYLLIFRPGQKIHFNTLKKEAENCSETLLVSTVSVAFLSVKYILCCLSQARGSVVVKTLCYELEGSGFETRWGEYIFFNLPNSSARTVPWGSLSL
jgi:hypothetical protein